MGLIPFDDRDGSIWFDGEMVPWRDAKTHSLSHGLHYASLVFEGERVYSGRIFKQTEHTARLRASAKILDFDVPISDCAVEAAVVGVLISTESWTSSAAESTSNLECLGASSNSS